MSRISLHDDTHTKARREAKARPSLPGNLLNSVTNCLSPAGSDDASHIMFLAANFEFDGIKDMLVLAHTSNFTRHYISQLGINEKCAFAVCVVSRDI